MSRLGAVAVQNVAVNPHQRNIFNVPEENEISPETDTFGGGFQATLAPESGGVIHATEVKTVPDSNPTISLCGLKMSQNFAMLIVLVIFLLVVIGITVTGVLVSRSSSDSDEKAGTSLTLLSPCSNDSECESSICHEGKCQLNRNSKACSKNEDCPSLICISDRDLCASPVTAGGNCINDENCESGMCRQKKCTDGNFGQTCVFNADCKSGRCYGRFSSCFPNVIGGWCDIDDGCFSGNCNGGVCDDSVDLGAECEFDSKCKNGYCDFGRETPICVELLENGQACERRQMCTSGHCSFEEDICTEAIAQGESCRISASEVVGNDLSCGEGNICDLDSLCSPLLQIGSDCILPHHCLNATCNFENRCAIPIEDGEACRQDSDCDSLNCDGDPSICMPALPGWDELQKYLIWLSS